MEFLKDPIILKMIEFAIVLFISMMLSMIVLIKMHDNNAAGRMAVILTVFYYVIKYILIK